MPTHTPAAARSASRYTPARFVVRVGSEWSPVRAAPIWPIAEVLDATAGLDAGSPTAGAEVGLALDLIDSGMIAPPRPRRRRERPVSSRAVFYQATDA